MGNAIAIILARAGSKGVPGKNRAPIAGRPCVEWTIDHALRARRVARVAVSTDDAEIAAIARRRGCVAIERPAALAGDTARVDDAARHALRELEAGRALAAEPAHAGRGVPSGIVAASTPIVVLYANVPVRPEGLIDRAVELLLSSGADSVQSYAPVGKFHPWWMSRLDERGRVRPWEGEVLNHGVFRRQDLPPALVPDGGVLVCTRAALMLEVPGVEPGPHAFFGRDRRGVVNDEGAVVDIDSPVDLLVADAILRGAADVSPGGAAGVPERAAPRPLS